MPKSRKDGSDLNSLLTGGRSSVARGAGFDVILASPASMVSVVTGPNFIFRDDCEVDGGADLLHATK